MAKSKRPSTNDQSNQHDSYREVEFNGLAVPVNSRPLDSFIQQGSLQRQDRYDWKTGKVIEERASVLRTAKADAMTLSHRAVASGRNLRKKPEEPGMGPCCPSPWGPRYK